MDKEKGKLAAQEKAILLQKQIMDNSRNINEYYKDFESWVEDMNKKDNKLLNIQSQEPKKEVIINEDAEIELKKEKIRKAKELARQNKLKRDGNSIKDYYDNWDRVNEDDELIDVESKITMDTKSNEEIIKNLYNEKQKSNAEKNVSISIKNNRNIRNNLKKSKITDEITERIEKLKKESNINYLIENYNKSIELYTYAIELLPKLNKNNVEENKTMAINLYNNRGNCQIKMKNYKVGIKDFTKVLNIDPNNLKGLYRRGLCYLNIDKYNLAFDDLLKAYEIAKEGNEKDAIKKELNNVVSKINSTIAKERKKMTNFIFNENAEFIKVKINDLPSAKVLRDTDNLISVQIKDKNKNNKNEEEKNNDEKNNNKNIKNKNKENEKESSFNISKTNYKEKKILKKEDIRQFIYDNQMSNISASSFKYAFKNFGNDITAKKEYLLKINPINLPTIFKTDLDKDSLLDMFRCFNLFEHESQIIEYLKNIIKIPRIKLVIQLISKKYKNIIFDVLDNLEKGDYGSEVIPIKDFFHNN